MELKSFFSPVELYNFEPRGGYLSDTWGASIEVHLEDIPSLHNKKIVIIGIKSKSDTALNKRADNIRHYLYKLKHKKIAETVADLGDLYLEDNQEMACQTLGFVLGELLDKEVAPIIIGGDQFLTYGLYLAYDYIKKYVNLVVVDNRIDFIFHDEDPINDFNYLNKIFYKKEGFLFNCSNIGYQSFFVDPETVELYDKYFFDTYRVGNIKANMTEIEPVIRNANFMSFDINAVRHSDAPGGVNSSPNGFTGEEACALARYSGLSDYLTCLGVFGYHEADDIGGRTAHLIAQMVWHFAEGMYFREDESPEGQSEGFTKYITSLKNNSYEIVFYKSKRTNRWWMEVPAAEADVKHYDKHLLPCSYQDYLSACQDELPERWWQAFKKLS